MSFFKPARIEYVLKLFKVHNIDVPFLIDDTYKDGDIDVIMVEDEASISQAQMVDHLLEVEPEDSNFNSRIQGYRMNSDTFYNVVQTYREAIHNVKVEDNEFFKSVVTKGFW